MYLVHDVFPYFSGICASVYAGHLAGDIVSHPHSRGIVAGVAAEPGVLTAVSGSCLTRCGHAVIQLQSASCAVGGGHGAFQDIGEHEGGIITIDLFGGRRQILGQVAVVLMDDLGDTGPVVVYTIIGQSTVSLSHVHHTDAVGKASDAQGGHAVVNVCKLLELHLSQIAEAVVHADVLQYLPCHCVQAAV